MQFTDFHAGGGKQNIGVIELPSIQQAHGFFVIKGVVKPLVTSLDMEIGAVRYKVELFGLFQRLDLFGGHGAGFQGLLQFQTLFVCTHIKHIAGNESRILCNRVLLNVGVIVRGGAVKIAVQLVFIPRRFWLFRCRFGRGGDKFPLVELCQPVHKRALFGKA